MNLTIELNGMPESSDLKSLITSMMASFQYRGDMKVVMSKSADARVPYSAALTVTDTDKKTESTAVSANFLAAFGQAFNRLKAKYRLSD